MTVKSNKELNRAVLVGGIFIFVTTFTVYIVGALSNVYFYQTTGQIAIQVAGGNVDKIIPTFICCNAKMVYIYILINITFCCYEYHKYTIPYTKFIYCT